MAAPGKSPNGTTKRNGHVSLAREEYDALMAREERFVEIVTDNAKLANRVTDLATICDGQVQRLLLTDTKVQHLERITALQSLFIDKLRADAPVVAALGELSEFWRQWQIHTHKAVDAKKATNDDVAKFEPDLFRAWRHWVRDSGKIGRVIVDAGSMSRADHDNAAPKTPAEMQEHVIRRLREDNAKLEARVRKLESESGPTIKGTP